MDAALSKVPSDCVYDLSAFDPANVNPQTIQLNRSIYSKSQEDAKWWEVGAEVYRDMREKGQAAFPAFKYVEGATNIDIPSREEGRTVLCRVIKPSTPSTQQRGIFLHIHGGGWVLGTAKGQDHLLSHIAENTGLTVLSVEYRLAPEHKYPAALHDCEDVADWLVTNSEATLGGKLCFLGGESAGATLCALVLLHLKERNKAAEIKGVALSYGCFDLSILPSLKLAPSTSPILTLEDAERFYSAYIEDMPLEVRKTRAVSPAYADLSGLCPALFLVGTEDALVDDSVLMHFRWLRAGNPAVLRFVPGAPHGFTLFDAAAVEVAKSGWQITIEFIRSLL
ncbi:hypothetical protein Z517_00555 [Fonsecaea pedrosoi CBS 271.37]|uniref:Alpha/beta hydrolase fold-3 domain-containing protein n=1 Tax=Fonsecaea pedrosoi CBS 271.37 TaxID=1442368 RepID=A0A0D2H2V2_9EURO|nr:uncharacterized protein Z517_00555 [Fonsecaea pedrosoi CBS 271.37]KIW85165.1 hypothetical protein Z517_00555 [Fonsecaea pedrosoi CBS 271.37]